MVEVDPNLLNDVDSEEKREQLTAQVSKVVEKILDEEAANLIRSERQRILREMVDEVVGFGPINSLLLDPTISEVMVNGPSQVYIERAGRLELTDVTFRDDAHVLHIIEKIVAPIGRRIDESMPMVDARLPDGSRVNAIIPPLALNGPTVTIRNFRGPPHRGGPDRLWHNGPGIARFLEACVKVRLNIGVSGGTGGGKTALLNVLSSFIPRWQIVTIEDAAELSCGRAYRLLESRPPNIEGRARFHPGLGGNSLRMRPDGIVVGKCGAARPLDMLRQ